MPKHTALYSQHLAANGKIVDFAGWAMPIHYGSQLEEHHQVRNDAGLFDVSHMTVLDLRGEQCRPFLQKLLANDVGKLSQPGKALYSCMLNEKGGVIDDLIVYFMNETWFRMVVNAATRDKDLAWIKQHAAAFSIDVKERDDLAMLAIQGPQAREKAHTALQQLGGIDTAPAQALKVFFAVELDDYFIARTGYTGEDGYEIMLSNDRAAALWQALLAVGVKPIGLGARDTLRLEAGMNLYGQDMDEQTTPLVSGLGWTVAWEPASRDFIGRVEIEQQKQQGIPQKLVGLVLQERGVLRPHQPVVTSAGSGETTSGSYSPTLETSIALARVPAETGATCQVQIRNKLLNAKVVKPPFVRQGKACFE